MGDYGKLSRRFCGAAFACVCALPAACGGGGGGGSSSNGDNGGGGPSLSLHSLALSAQRPAVNVTLAAANEATVPFDEDADAEYNSHPNLKAINAAEAYRRGYFGQGVIVGVLDSGILRAHEDFEIDGVKGANVLPGYDFQRAYLLTTSGMPVPAEVPVNMDYSGHGTPVAAVIGAARNGVGGQGVAPSARIMPLQVLGDVNGPFSFFHGERAYAYAARRGVPILNISYGNNIRLTARTPVPLTLNDGREAEILEATVPHLPELLALNAPLHAEISNRFARVREIIKNEDMVVVYAAGNDGWNNAKGRVGMRIRYAADGSEGRPSYRADEFSIHQHIIDNFESVEYGRLATLGIGANETGALSMGPAYEAELFGKWVAVVALDQHHLTLAHFSNACGKAKYWCLAAPGVNFTVAGNSNIGRDNHYGYAGGTSMAAPMVSGALAVLRGRFPDMPMSAILAVLFRTATDAGAPGVDEVYGHGLLNLGAAITVQGEMRLELPGGAQAGGLDAGGAGAPVAGALAAGGRIHLPPALAGLRERINNISVAVSYLDGYYYDMPLSRFLAVDGNAGAMLSGNAAADMLQGEQQAQMLGGLSAVVNERAGALSALSYAGGGFRFSYDLPCEDCVSAWERGAAADDIMRPYFAASARRGAAGWRLSDSIEVFAARGFEDEDKRQPSYEQLGLRWQAGEGPVRMLSEFSRVEEKDSLLGATGDALGDLSAQTYQGRVRLQSSLAGWQLSGDYVYGETKGKAKGGLISGISGLRFAGWGMEAMRRSLLRGGDELRIGMRRHARTRGKVRLWQTRAGAPRFVEDLHLPLRDKVEYSEAVVTDLGALPTIWRAGYSAPLSPRISAAVALEYADAPQADDEWSASAHLIWAF